MNNPDPIDYTILNSFLQDYPLETPDHITNKYTIKVRHMLDHPPTPTYDINTIKYFLLYLLVTGSQILP